MPMAQEAKADIAFTAFANTVGIRSLPLGPGEETTDGADARAWHRPGMPGRSFRVARIAGIPVGISPW